MGKSSRIKRERRASGERKATPMKPKHPLIFNNKQRAFTLEKPKTPVYRYFREPQHAEDLANGRVWISTLETCRQYEDPAQGDPLEGHISYNSGFVNGDFGDPQLMTVARHAGIYIGEGSRNITINAFRSRRHIPDAFVICTTENFQPTEFRETFGQYCVEITDPERFFNLVNAALKCQTKKVNGNFGRVIYADRMHYGQQPEPGHIGFVKPPTPYKTQSEVRFLWTVEQHEKLSSFMINVPGVSSICRLVD